MTDENGNFTIACILPGTYKVQAWHEALGILEKSVTIKVGAAAEVNFDILPKE